MWFTLTAQATISRENWECEVGFWSALQALLAQVSASTSASAFGLGAQKGRRGQKAQTDSAVAEVLQGFACWRFLARFLTPVEP